MGPTSVCLVLVVISTATALQCNGDFSGSESGNTTTFSNCDSFNGTAPTDITVSSDADSQAKSGAIIAAVIGAAVFMLLILNVVLWMVFRHMRRQRRHAAEAPPHSESSNPTNSLEEGKVAEPAKNNRSSRPRWSLLRKNAVELPTESSSRRVELVGDGPYTELDSGQIYEMWSMMR